MRIPDATYIGLLAVHLKATRRSFCSLYDLGILRHDDCRDTRRSHLVRSATAPTSQDHWLEPPPLHRLEPFA